MKKLLKPIIITIGGLTIGVVLVMGDIALDIIQPNCQLVSIRTAEADIDDLARLSHRMLYVYHNEKETIILPSSAANYPEVAFITILPIQTLTPNYAAQEDRKMEIGGHSKYKGKIRINIL